MLGLVDSLLAALVTLARAAATLSWSELKESGSIILYRYFRAGSSAGAEASLGVGFGLDISLFLYTFKMRRSSYWDYLKPCLTMSHFLTTTTAIGPNETSPHADCWYRENDDRCRRFPHDSIWLWVRVFLFLSAGPSPDHTENSEIREGWIQIQMNCFRFRFKERFLVNNHGTERERPAR